MKNLKLISSAGLMSCLLVSLTLFFTSTITTSTSTDQTVAKLSSDIAKLNVELATLKSEKEDSDWDDPSLGEIVLFAGNYAPRNWAFCDGQRLSIASNSALFSILGTNYGGDGRTDFALPDLRGRVPLHVGDNAGPGLSRVVLGQRGGMETATFKSIDVATGTGAKVKVVNGTIPGNNLQPYTGLNYIIAISGTYPSRS